jgi:hypothetical protein
MKSWAFLHNWYMPFVWAVGSAAASIPVAVYLQQGMNPLPGAQLGLAYGDGWVLRDDFLASIVVYALTLGSSIWLFDGDGSTRWAAFWATLYAVGRLAVPIALVTMSDVTVGIDTHYIDWNVMRIVIWFQDAQMLLLGIMLWGGFARFVGKSSAAVSHSLHYAEA